MNVARRIRHLLLALAAIATGLPARSAVVDRNWEAKPYRVQVVLLVNAPALEAAVLQDELQQHVSARIDASMGALWDGRASLQLLTFPRSIEANCEALLQSLSEDDLTTLDKLIVVQVEPQDGQYVLHSREYDFFVKQWGNVAADTAVWSYVPECAFRMVTAVFAPIATYRIDPKDNAKILLSYRGSQLPATKDGHQWSPPGTILVPILRRSDSSGQSVSDGIERVRWTYLQVASDDPTGRTAKVYSHTRQPFAFRQRGRVDQLALAVRGEPSPVTIRLHNRVREEQRLGGFDVYLQDQDATETRVFGRTNRDGEIVIPPGPTRIQTAFVKSGAITLAKLPIVAGDLPVIVTPLPDHRQRLAAEAKLSLIREQLIDVVARRAIMAARINRFITDGDTDTARKLLEEFDNLPGRSQFDAMLTKEQQLSRADDPLVAKQIATLYDKTRAVLNEFLDASVSGQLRSKILAAEAGEAPSTTAEEESG